MEGSATLAGTQNNSNLHFFRQENTDEIFFFFKRYTLGCMEIKIDMTMHKFGHGIRNMQYQAFKMIIGLCVGLQSLMAMHSIIYCDKFMVNNVWINDKLGSVQTRVLNVYEGGKLIIGGAFYMTFFKKVVDKEDEVIGIHKMQLQYMCMGASLLGGIFLRILLKSS